jgi:hypothetical protein
MSAEEETPRCDVRLMTRSVGSGQAFTVRGLLINDREYRIPANSEVTIHASTRPGICTLTVTLFPTSIQFEPEEQP